MDGTLIVAGAVGFLVGAAATLGSVLLFLRSRRAVASSVEEPVQQPAYKTILDPATYDAGQVPSVEVPPTMAALLRAWTKE